MGLAQSGAMSAEMGRRCSRPSIADAACSPDPPPGGLSCRAPRGAFARGMCERVLERYMRARVEAAAVRL